MPLIILRGRLPGMDLALSDPRNASLAPFATLIPHPNFVLALKAMVIGFGVLLMRMPEHSLISMEMPCIGDKDIIRLELAPGIVVGP